MRTRAAFLVVALACGACGGAPAKKKSPSTSVTCETLLEATGGAECLALRSDACWAAGTCGEPRTARCKGLLAELEQKCDDRAK